MFTVYVLRSASTGKLYIGQTGDLHRRLEEHRQGVARYTRGRGPWHLVYSQGLETRSAAVSRERFLKSGQGREWLHAELIGRAVPPQAD